MRKVMRFVICAVVIVALQPEIALPQALPNLSTLRLSYNVRKETVNPQGELKLKIDALDRELAEATRLGRIGEVRRLLAKGLTLLGGNEWTDVLDFSNSLVARSDRVFVDPVRPYTVRLEQIYSPSIALERPLMARASLRTPPAPQPGLAGVGTAPPVGELVQDLGTSDEVSRDLRESPLRMELDLSGVANGAYQIHLDVLDGDRSLGSAAVGIVVHKGLETALTGLETEAARVPETLVADVLFPADYVRNVNRGRIARGAFDIAKEIAGAEAVVISPVRVCRPSSISSIRIGRAHRPRCLSGERLTGKTLKFNSRRLHHPHFVPLVSRRNWSFGLRPRGLGQRFPSPRNGGEG